MPISASSGPTLALGRIPTGLYVVTALQDGEPVGFVASFLMQVGFAPPTICVAVAKDRPQLAAMRAAGCFGVNVLDEASSGLMSSFLKRGAGDPFQKLKVSSGPGGSPVLDDALAWLECRIRGEFSCPDHVIVFGEAEEGRILREGEPAMRLRKHGLVY